MSESTADILTIIQCINRFGMAIDRRDWESFRTLFASEVSFDYSSIGEVAGVLTPDEVVANARKDLGGFKTTQHVITNHIIEIEDSVAHCQAHVRAMHYLPKEVESILEMGGYYEAEFIKESRWLIKNWKFTLLWSQGNEQLFEIAKKTANEPYDSPIEKKS